MNQYAGEVANPGFFFCNSQGCYNKDGSNSEMFDCAFVLPEADLDFSAAGCFTERVSFDKEYLLRKE